MLRHTCKSCGCGPLLVVLVVFLVLDMASNVASKMKVHSFFCPIAAPPLAEPQKKTLWVHSPSLRVPDRTWQWRKRGNGDQTCYLSKYYTVLVIEVHNFKSQIWDLYCKHLLDTFTISVRYFSHKIA